MISPIANSGIGAVDAQRIGKSPSGTSAAVSSREAQVATPAARLASFGPPIDVTRVAAIKAAIAESTYTVDADRLAAAMMALDLPPNPA